MSGAARAFYRQSQRKHWGTRPKFREDGVTPYPLNTHVPKYNTRAQDPLARRPGPRALQSVYWDKAKPLRPHGNYKFPDRVIQASIGDLAVWVGDILNNLNPGQSAIASDPIPRSTLCYWIDFLKDLKMVVEYDEVTGRQADPRHRGDGRHKTTWRVRSMEHALDLLAADPAVATPSNRNFWTLNGRPISTQTAVDWQLDKAVAERNPAAWENNARFYNPDAPMKPLRRTEQKRPATQEEVDKVHNALLDPWGIASTPQQAADILRWARERYQIPADDLVATLYGAIENQIAHDRKKRQPSIFTIKFFGREMVGGLVNLWNSNKRRAEAEKARADRAAAEATRLYGSDSDPPF